MEGDWKIEQTLFRKVFFKNVLQENIAWKGITSKILYALI